MLKTNLIITAVVGALLIGIAIGVVLLPQGAEKLEELTVAFMPQEDPQVILGKAENLANYLSQELGMKVKVYVPLSYAATVEAIAQNHAQVAFFSAWPAYLARREVEKRGANIFPIAAELRPEILELNPESPVEGQLVPGYNSHFYTKTGSGINTLADLAGKRVAFTSPTSTSGYLMPVAKLVEENIIGSVDDLKGFFSEIRFAGGYQQALIALANGDVDVAAASDYAYYRYLTLDQRQQIKAISTKRTVTHLVAVRGDLPYSIVEKLKGAIARQDESMLRVYGARGYALVGDEHIAVIENAVQLAGI
jgi:phosphonate transport system substrate-binding protein